MNKQFQFRIFIVNDLYLAHYHKLIVNALDVYLCDLYMYGLHAEVHAEVNAKMIKEHIQWTMGL